MYLCYTGCTEVQSRFSFEVTSKVPTAVSAVDYRGLFQQRHTTFSDQKRSWNWGRCFLFPALSLSASLQRRNTRDKVMLVGPLSTSGGFRTPGVKASVFSSCLYGLQVHRWELGNFVLITSLIYTGDRTEIKNCA